MPIIKQAIKKLRRDRELAQANAVKREMLRSAIKAYRKSPSKKSLSDVFSKLDKAAKTHIIHANKASRLKERLSKLVTK